MKRILSLFLVLLLLSGCSFSKADTPRSVEPVGDITEREPVAPKSDPEELTDSTSVPDGGLGAGQVIDGTMADTMVLPVEEHTEPQLPGEVAVSFELLDTRRTGYSSANATAGFNTCVSEMAALLSHTTVEEFKANLELPSEKLTFYPYTVSTEDGEYRAESGNYSFSVRESWDGGLEAAYSAYLEESPYDYEALSRNIADCIGVYVTEDDLSALVNIVQEWAAEEGSEYSYSFLMTGYNVDGDLYVDVAPDYLLISATRIFKVE